MKTPIFTLAAIGLIALAACSGNSDAPAPTADAPDTTQAAVPDVPVRTPSGTPEFTLAWSYYTSWSALAGAGEFGDFDGRKGWMTGLEVEHGVDLVLTRDEYLNTFGIYATGTADAVTMTNTDALGVAVERKNKKGDASVAVLPTSYSHGADKILVETSVATDWASFAGTPLRAEEFSVTHYLLWRCSALNGTTAQFGQPGGYTLEHLAVLQGAPQMAMDTDGISAFGGWPPEVFTVLDKRGADVTDVCNSSALGKYEITDLLVVGESTLQTDGGKAGVKVLAEAMNRMVDRLSGSEREAALRAISTKFDGLETGKIDRALQISTIFAPKANATSVLNSTEMRNNMPLVADFTSSVVGVTDPAPYAWATDGDVGDAVLIFDPGYSL